MIALALGFASGRYHATPWGRHVNEAAAEWPPSPWRLLRSFIATWKRKLDGDPACPPEVMESLFWAIVPPPRLFLPPATTGHSRHYMPWFKKGPDDKTLVFDGFVAVAKDSEIIVFWPTATLNDQEQIALARVCEVIGFLGRAESWVKARLLTDGEARNAQSLINCFPASDKSSANHESVRVLCANPSTAFDNEYTPKIERTEGRGRGKRKILTPLYDPDWHICLETFELHEKGWSDPPGSQWVTYWRPKDCFTVTESSPGRKILRPGPTVARFAFDAPVLPLVEETLRVGEIARFTAMGCFRRSEEKRVQKGFAPFEAPLPRSKVFSGKDDQGVPLSGHHHSFYLPTDEDEDGRLDHLTIIAEMGFGPPEECALDGMRSLRFREGEPVRLLLLGLGSGEIIQAPKILGPSRVWVSATPFIATRHQKTRGRKKDPPRLLGLENRRAFARQVLIEEIARLRERRPDIPEPLSVEPLNEENRCGTHLLLPIQFKRFRQRKLDEGGRLPCGVFRIVFSELVRGPIAVGHSSHFGLGLFVPEIQFIE